MKKQEIKAGHKLNSGKTVEKTGSIDVYTDDELQKFIKQGMTEYHAKTLLNQIIIIRAQDALRADLIDDDPAKVLFRKLKAKIKKDPAFREEMTNELDEKEKKLVSHIKKS